jgi:hypothetical protein
MPLQKGHKGFHDVSTTPAIINSELRQIANLAAVAGNEKCDIANRYQALGMIQDRLEAIDRRFCECYYNQIPEGLPQKSYEELTNKVLSPRAMTAAAARR